jgi:hypothetical protein
MLIQNLDFIRDFLTLPNPSVSLLVTLLLEFS